MPKVQAYSVSGCLSASVLSLTLSSTLTANASPPRGEQSTHDADSVYGRRPAVAHNFSFESCPSEDKDRFELYAS